MMQEVARVHFDDELPYSEQSLRRSCRRFYSNFFDTTKPTPVFGRNGLQRSLCSLPRSSDPPRQQLMKNNVLSSYAAREQEKERWVEPESTLHLTGRRCASELALNDNALTCAIPAQQYSWVPHWDHRLAAQDRFQPKPSNLSRRRSFSSLPHGPVEETNRWRQAVVTSTKDYCTRRDRAYRRRTLSGHWPSLDEAAFRNSKSSDPRCFPPGGLNQNSLTQSQCNFCHRSEQCNQLNTVASPQGHFQVQLRDSSNLKEDTTFIARGLTPERITIHRDILSNKRIPLSDYNIGNQSSSCDFTKEHAIISTFQAKPLDLEHETWRHRSDLDRIEQNKIFGTIRQFQDPFLLAKFSNVTNCGVNKLTYPSKGSDENEDNATQKDLSNDDSETTSCSSVHETALPTPVMGRREERTMGKNYSTETKLVYKSDSALHTTVRKAVTKKMSLLQKACLAARSVKRTLQRAFSHDNIKFKTSDNGVRKSSMKSRTSANVKLDTEAPVSVQLLKVHDDGSLLVELRKNSAGTIGFFVAQGKLKNHKGIFVCRMISMKVRAHLSGLIEIGDEILKLDGIPVSGEEVSKVNSTLTSRSIILLTILPYTYRNEVFVQ